jgi:hypothetical protein
MYKLVKVKPAGLRVTLIEDHDKDYLIETGTTFQTKYPSERFGVTDKLGFFVWPEHLAKAHITPNDYDPSKVIVPDRYGSAEQ